MINEYTRPKSLAEALALLQRPEPKTVPLAGGTALNRQQPEPLAVVDLQDLRLDQVRTQGRTVELGAMVTLQRLQELAEEGKVQAELKEVVEREATYNLRQVATLGGTVAAADGRSPLLTALLALEAHLQLQLGEEEISLGDLLPLRAEKLKGRLITGLTLSLQPRLAYAAVARTPADRPIVCAALAAWPSGRMRLALGGYGPVPALAFDGSGAEGLEIAARSAYAAAADEWASAEYRLEVAAVLSRRCWEQLFPAG